MVYIRMQEEFKTISCVYICIFVQSFTVGHETEEEGCGAFHIVFSVPFFFYFCCVFAYMYLFKYLYLCLQGKSVGRVTEGRRRLSRDEVTQLSGKRG